MRLFKLLLFSGPLLATTITWLLVRHRNFETRRKTGEIFLVLAPIVTPVLLLILYLISR